MSPGPSFLYLHGFASSTASTKARAFVAWGQESGIDVKALDLRTPSLEHLRFSAMKARVHEAIDSGGPRNRVVLVGSSLGGLTALRVAENEPRVAAVFLMAPALRLAEQWRVRLGEEAWARWRETNAFEVTDHATNEKTTVDFRFVEELAELDSGDPDVRVPTCIVHGTRDDVVDIERSRLYVSERSHAHLVEVDDGHELNASLPRIRAAASTFLRPFGIQ